MDWFSIALSCAFFTACADALSKRIMQGTDEWIAGAVILGLSCLILAPLFLAQELRPVSWELLAVLAAALPLEILSYYLFLSAIRIAPLSLTLPLLAFTPAFTVLTAGAALGEQITLSGAIGIALVTVGAYLLNANLVHVSILAPLKAIFTNPGPRRMLLVAIIWSVTSTLGKQGLLIYGAIPFGFVITALVCVFFALVGLARLRLRLAGSGFKLNSVGLYVAAGLFMAASQMTHFISLSMAPVAYMIAVKRLSLVFGVMMGWIFFHEENIANRLVGASIMAAGALLLQI
jgi:uncharacterized membrane protein